MSSNSADLSSYHFPMAMFKPPQLELSELWVRSPSCTFPEPRLHIAPLWGYRLARGWLEQAASLSCIHNWAVWAFSAQLYHGLSSGNGWRDDGWYTELDKHTDPSGPSQAQYSDRSFSSYRRREHGQK